MDYSKTHSNNKDLLPSAMMTKSFSKGCPTSLGDYEYSSWLDLLRHWIGILKFMFGQNFFVFRESNMWPDIKLCSTNHNSDKPPNVFSRSMIIESD